MVQVKDNEEVSNASANGRSGSFGLFCPPDTASSSSCFGPFGRADDPSRSNINSSPLATRQSLFDHPNVPSLLASSTIPPFSFGFGSGSLNGSSTHSSFGSESGSSFASPSLFGCPRSGPSFASSAASFGVRSDSLSGCTIPSFTFGSGSSSASTLFGPASGPSFASSTPRFDFARFSTNAAPSIGTGSHSNNGISSSATSSFSNGAANIDANGTAIPPFSPQPSGPSSNNTAAAANNSTCPSPFGPHGTDGISSTATSPFSDAVKVDNTTSAPLSSCAATLINPSVNNINSIPSVSSPLFGAASVPSSNTNFLASQEIPRNGIDSNVTTSPPFGTPQHPWSSAEKVANTTTTPSCSCTGRFNNPSGNNTNSLPSVTSPQFGSASTDFFASQEPPQMLSSIIPPYPFQAHNPPYINAQLPWNSSPAHISPYPIQASAPPYINAQFPWNGSPAPIPPYPIQASAPPYINVQFPWNGCPESVFNACNASNYYNSFTSPYGLPRFDSRTYPYALPPYSPLMMLSMIPATRSVYGALPGNTASTVHPTFPPMFSIPYSPYTQYGPYTPYTTPFIDNQLTHCTCCCKCNKANNEPEHGSTLGSGNNSGEANATFGANPQPSVSKQTTNCIFCCNRSDNETNHGFNSEKTNATPGFCPVPSSNQFSSWPKPPPNGAIDNANDSNSFKFPTPTVANSSPFRASSLFQPGNFSLFVANLVKSWQPDQLKYAPTRYSVDPNFDLMTITAMPAAGNQSVEELRWKHCQFWASFGGPKKMFG